MVFAVLGMAAQSLDVNAVALTSDKNAKGFVELTHLDGNSVTYAYCEYDWKYRHDKEGSAYTQLFREQKFWQTPVYLHSELRSFTMDNALHNTYYCGLAYSFNYDAGYTAVEPLYRYDHFDRNGVQLSVVGALSCKRLMFEYFCDTWWSSASSLMTYVEVRPFVKITDSCSIGGVLSMQTGIHTGFDYSVMLGVKYSLHR